MHTRSSPYAHRKFSPPGRVRYADLVTNPEVAAALAELARTMQDVAMVIDAIVDPDEAFSDATTLGLHLAQHVETAARLRAHAAQRIYDAEQMTLAELAARISVSKSRAHQFLDAAKKERES